MISEDEVYQGNDLDFICDVVDLAEAPKVITGLLGATYQISKSGSKIAAITKTLGDGVTLLTPTSLRIQVTDDETQNLSKAHVHELKITDSNGKEATLFSKPLYFISTIIE